MRILSIDQSFTYTGYCVADIEDDNITLLDTGVITSDKELSIYERAKTIADELAKVCQDWSVDEVICEQLAYGGVGNATRNLAGLLFVIIVNLACNPNKITYNSILTVAPTSAKKALSGNGKATKQQMFEALPEDIKDKLSKSYLKTKGLFDVTDAYAFLVWRTKQK